MVVSSVIYLLLAEAILSGTGLVFMFAKNRKTFSKIIRIICAILVILIAVSIIPLQMAMGRFYGSQILIIFCMVINLIVATMELKEKR